ncbi:MAG: hypothetical protein HOP11_03165 [Saprospiraceae bacterium]|nr:hypothetical protein [Saprospiraceae bacterium]
MKNQVFLLSAILVLWITLSALVYNEKCCTSQKIPIKTTNTKRAYFHGIVLQDSDKLNLKLRDNFIFYKATSGYLLPLSDSLKQLVQTTADYLKENPNKKLKIICRYSPKENTKLNNSDYGLLRSKEIEKIFLSKGVPAKQLITKSLKDTLLPIINNRIFGGFIPLIVNE